MYLNHSPATAGMHNSQQASNVASQFITAVCDKCTHAHHTVMLGTANCSFDCVCPQQLLHYSGQSALTTSCAAPVLAAMLLPSRVRPNTSMTASCQAGPGAALTAGSRSGEVCAPAVPAGVHLGAHLQGQTAMAGAGLLRIHGVGQRS